MDVLRYGWVLVIFSCFSYSAYSYETKNHPCCQGQGDNLTLAMVLDPFEIYGHDPADKLDHLLHYRTEMMKIKNATDQYIINEHVHIATDHLDRFVQLHVKELKILQIALDDTVDNMITMFENHNSIKTERIATYNGGAVPMEFYVSQEFYCGKNVYLFVSEIYSDIYYMGRGQAPYCKGRAFFFMGFVHHLEDNKYYLEDDSDTAFPMDDFNQGLECHLGICIYRFPQKKLRQLKRDVVMLPKAIVKCGLTTYKLPPLTDALCIVASGSFILDFNIQGIQYRHHDFLLTLPNGQVYYTKENGSPLSCHHHVCEWTFKNFYGGPFSIPGDPSVGHVVPIPPWVESTTQPYIPNTTEWMDGMDDNNSINSTTTYTLEGCWYMFPPNYGSIAGVSYLDPLTLHDYRYTCQGTNKGLYWYPHPDNVLPPIPEQFFSSAGLQSKH